LATANSKEITVYKNKIMKSIYEDYEFVRLIDESYVDTTSETVLDSADELRYKKIFPYYFNPLNIEEAISFVIIKIDTPKTKGELIKEMVITITAVSSQSIMQVDFGAGTRIDQMGYCIDRLFNARDDLGFGYLELFSCYETSIDETHRCREYKFKVDAFNISRCNNER
jgi:hypothetical protein